MKVKRRQSSVMTLPSVSSVDSAENVFLEVLLPNFTLTREPHKSGVHLEVAFDGSTPATWNRKGRGSVREWMKDAFGSASSRSRPSRADLYQQKLDAILFKKKPGTFVPSDGGFLWRWASGGTLPVVSIGERSYYCLFFRDIFPIGWNIANGACDTRFELLNPLEALERELGEELVVLNPKHGKRIRYVLNPEERPALDRAEFRNYRRLWQKQFPKLDLLNFKREGLAFKWERGPDKVTIRTDYGSNEFKDCFVNINTLDFGIEIDRIARIAITDEEVLCDGDINDRKDRVLNRPVGLFDINRMQQELRDGNDKFIPDRFFYSGKKSSGESLEELVEGVFIEDMRSWREEKEVAAFQQTSNEFDLCPVTRSLISRHRPKSGASIPRGNRIPLKKSPEKSPEKLFDVFISFGDPDRKHARKVFEFIKRRSHHPFFAPESLARHPGPWADAIDSALESATSLIAIASKPKNLKRDEVQYEIRAFRTVHGTKARMIPFLFVLSARTNSPCPCAFMILCTGIRRRRGLRRLFGNF